MTLPPYVDTSALAKWYLNEARSDDVEGFLTQQSHAAISRVTVIEFRCLLARRRRAGDIGRPLEARIFAAFEDDIRRGFLNVIPLEDEQAAAAVEMISSLRKHPLRTLDALHLAVARSVEVTLLATADRVMAAAAEALGFQVVRFD